jgi:tight adherence protein C
MNGLALALGLLAAAGVGVVALGVRLAEASDAAALARERMARQDMAVGGSLTDLELTRPLAERMLMPLRRAITRLVNRWTPATQSARIQRQLDLAGNPFGLDPAGIQALRVASGAALAAIGTAIGILTDEVGALIVFLVAGLAVGFYLPNIWLSQAVRQRRAQLELALPDALDVVAISMEAGLSLDRALEQLAKYQKGPFTDLVSRALQEIELGRPRAEALEDMSDRMGMEDFIALVRSITHAERSGVPIARAIEAHAAQMRVRRRLKIRADAARASLKMLIPTVGCVFPTLWLILLGPALLVALSIARH